MNLRRPAPASRRSGNPRPVAVTLLNDNLIWIRQILQLWFDKAIATLSGASLILFDYMKALRRHISAELHFQPIAVRSLDRHYCPTSFVRGPPISRPYLLRLMYVSQLGTQYPWLFR